MDFNIATALYFASKGEGVLFDENSFDINSLHRSEKFHDNDKNKKTHAKKEKYKNKKQNLTKKELITIQDEETHDEENKNYISNFKMKEYISTAKIVMSGLGADEIFGGYMRYWVAYRRGGYTELRNEMDFGIIET